jgi:hypothetical protein
MLELAKHNCTKHLVWKWQNYFTYLFLHEWIIQQIICNHIFNGYRFSQLWTYFFSFPFWIKFDTTILLYKKRILKRACSRESDIRTREFGCRKDIAIATIQKSVKCAALFFSFVWLTFLGNHKQRRFLK